LIEYLIQAKREQAELRARLAKAKSIQDALIILKSTGIQGRMRMYQSF
jgi:hypothetical protein